MDGVRAPVAASAAAAPGLPPALHASRLRRWLARWRRRETLVAYLFVAPWLVGMTAFYLGPTIASFVYSFTKYPIIAKPIQSRKAVDDVLGEVYAFATSDQRRLLLVEPDPVRLATLREYLDGNEKVEIIAPESTTVGAWLPKLEELLRALGATENEDEA